MAKTPPGSVGDIRDVRSIPGSGRSLEEGMAAHSSILALQYSYTVYGYVCVYTHTHTHTHTHTRYGILILPFAWMDLGGIMLSEITQKRTRIV